ncbi:DUF2076 domain-containing protein [Methylocystis sp. WRRC1]|uniref:DUF2076 domain-containing protein n=1 Tax=Methylocystis sp. WRRC1 TaxID=1732014 RepID=UPI001D15E2AA|nr:DUF2076 domain-containing protein [Methylocystis sp. WRRC1]MCC3247182.1 DUF2076 domain-containing protein [Methylocystis sp. WRRC1]
MDSNLLDRLQRLEFHQWKDGQTIACLRNPDGCEAATYIMKLEARIQELEEEIAALDQILENNSPRPCEDGIHNEFYLSQFAGGYG